MVFQRFYYLRILEEHFSVEKKVCMLKVKYGMS